LGFGIFRLAWIDYIENFKRIARLTRPTGVGVTATPAWDPNGDLMSEGVRTYTWDARDA
jgi:hypothetical protein